MTENKIINALRKTAFFITLFLSSAAFIIVKNDADLDLWHRMAVGKIFSQVGWVIYNDIFSYLPNKEMWVDHEWLSGVIFYDLGKFFGDYGLLTLQILIIFSILILIYRINQLIYPENKYRISFYLIALLGIYVGFGSIIRCQSFTYLFFTLWIYLLEKIRRGENRLIWIFPATMLLWANMHAGFLAGIGLIVFYIIGEFLNKKNVSKYFLILAMVVPVTLITPYGIKYWVYILNAVAMPRPYMTEWLPLNPFKSFYAWFGFNALFLILLAGYGYKIFSKKLKFDKVEIIALLITFYMSIKHERHSVFFVILAASYGYQHFIIFLNAIYGKFENKISEFFQNQDLNEKLYFAKEYGTYFFLIITSWYLIFSSSISITLQNYPIKAVEFIRKNNITGNLFVPFNWGSYAMWKLYPQNLISIDGRFEETYKLQSYLDVSEFTFFKKKAVLNKYHNDIFLLKKPSEAYGLMKSLQGWKIVYENKKSAVFLPSSNKKSSWKMPENNLDYYDKTKYENNINF